MAPLLPDGCDTHVHVIGPADHYPMVEDRHYTPGPASVQQLRDHLAGQGIGRAVIIQPSVYGTDNRCLVDALDAMQGQARGVAVLPEDASSSQLHALDARGVRGIRINLESSGGARADALRTQLRAWAPRLADLGWHVQVYVPLDVIAACEDTVRDLPVPLVLDHVGLWPDAACEAPECRSVLGLLESGALYMKLSASYRVPLQGSQLARVASRVLALRPDRLLWASDWPHTNREPGKHRLEVSRYRDITPQALRDERVRWMEEAELAQQVLVRNPQQLYRF